MVYENEVGQVCTETYKKWEQGVRPPAPKYVAKVYEFTGHAESET